MIDNYVENKLEFITVPTCANNQEVNEMINTISKLIIRLFSDNYNIEIHLDITHSFRIHPVLLINTIFFILVSMDKLENLTKIFYVMESRYTNSNYADIIDISNLILASQLAYSVRELINSGISENIETILTSLSNQIRRRNPFYQIKRSLEIYSNILLLSDTVKLRKDINTIYNSLDKSVSEIMSNHPDYGYFAHAFNRIISRLKESTDNISSNPLTYYTYHKELARQALENRRLSAFFTQLREGVISWIIENRFRHSEYVLDRYEREKTNELVRKIINKEYKDDNLALAAQLTDKIRDKRNCISHAFMNPDCEDKIKKIYKSRLNYINDLKKLLEEFEALGPPY